MNDAIDNPALFLTYRRFFPIPQRELVAVNHEDEILDHLKASLQKLPSSSGILLSGGIDSTLLARFMPAGSTAYTIDYEEAGRKSELQEAAKFVGAGVRHKAVLVSREQYFQAAEELMLRKHMPLVPHEPPVAIACRQALRDGVTHLVGGWGADTRFGSYEDYYRNARWDDFQANILYKYWNPSEVLKESSDVSWVARQYLDDGAVDVQRFLLDVGTEGNAIYTTIQGLGLTPVFPFVQMRYGPGLDVERIINGEGKYLLKSIFRRIYPKHALARKVPLHVPYNKWMMGYQPTRKEFKDTLKLKPDQGKRNALIFSLERYFTHLENGWQSTGSVSSFPIRNRVARWTRSMSRAVRRVKGKRRGATSTSTEAEAVR